MAHKATHSPIHAVAIPVDENIEEKIVEEVDDGEEELHSAAAIVINEFLRTIFPGRTLFKGRGNALELISTYHNYFCMFAGSGLTRSRTIRFLKVISVVLSCIFADTLFFGIYYPSQSVCSALTDKVRFGECKSVTLVVLTCCNECTLSCILENRIKMTVSIDKDIDI